MKNGFTCRKKRKKEKNPECYPASEIFFVLLCVLLDSGRNLRTSEGPGIKYII